MGDPHAREEGRKTFIPLENNPEVMNHLAANLGLSPTLKFHDMYSLTEPSLLSLLPRPAHALLFIVPGTPINEAHFRTTTALEPAYTAHGPDQPVLFYKQTIGHACGLIGLLHCASNGPAAAHITPGSLLARLVAQAVPLAPDARAQLLYDSVELEDAHMNAARMGDSHVPAIEDPVLYAYIAFVRGQDGHLWELEGARKGPLDLGHVGEGEDVLSESCLRRGPWAYLEREKEAGSGEYRFSCLMLAPAEN